MPENRQKTENDRMASVQHSITVFFPCYNEAASVEKLVHKAITVLEKITPDFEIIIVNDGSCDRTGEIADNLARNISRLRIVHHPTNLGYGAALQSGFRAAKKELVFFTDGDAQFDLDELPQLVPLIQNYDMVIGYRLNRREGFVRKFNSWCWTKLVCLLFGMKIRDIDCAFKLFKRAIFDDIKMESAGALISAEILARAVHRGYTVTEVGVHHYPRTAGAPTGARISVIVRAFIELLRLRRKILSE